MHRVGALPSHIAGSCWVLKILRWDLWLVVENHGGVKGARSCLFTEERCEPRNCFQWQVLWRCPKCTIQWDPTGIDFERGSPYGVDILQPAESLCTVPYLFIEGCGSFFWPFWDCSILGPQRYPNSEPYPTQLDSPFGAGWGRQLYRICGTLCGTEMHDLHNFGLEHLLPNPDNPVSLGFVFDRTGVKLETSQLNMGRWVKIGFRNVAYWISIFPGLGGIETWSRLLEARHQLHGAASSMFQGESYQKMPRAQAGGQFHPSPISISKGDRGKHSVAPCW